MKQTPRRRMLTDFLDDAVSASTESRKVQKTFVAQISEIDLPLLVVSKSP